MRCCCCFFVGVEEEGGFFCFGGEGTFIDEAHAWCQRGLRGCGAGRVRVVETPGEGKDADEEDEGA